ncbi:hypothetical protein U1Q18_014473 [Sarracenia purpurea var. burkii]
MARLQARMRFLKGLSPIKVQELLNSPDNPFKTGCDPISGSSAPPRAGVLFEEADTKIHAPKVKEENIHESEENKGEDGAFVGVPMEMPEPEFDFAAVNKVTEKVISPEAKEKKTNMAQGVSPIDDVQGLSPVKAEDRVGTTKEESSPGGPPFLKAEEPSVVNPPAYEGKGREGDVQEETYTVGKKVVTPPVYVSAKAKDEKYNFSDKVDPILDLGLVDGYEGMILEVNEEAKDDVEAETLIHFQDNIKPEMLDLGSGLEGISKQGNLNPTQVSVKMPKTNSGSDTVSIDAPLNPVATRGSYASHSGAGEWPRAVNDGNEGQNGHEASKSWASK